MGFQYRYIENYRNYYDTLFNVLNYIIYKVNRIIDVECNIIDNNIFSRNDNIKEAYK